MEEHKKKKLTVININAQSTNLISRVSSISNDDLTFENKELLENKIRDFVPGADLWSSSFSNKFSIAVSTISDKFFQVHSVNDLLYNQQNEYKNLKDISFVTPDRFNFQLEQSNIKNLASVDNFQLSTDATK